MTDLVPYIPKQQQTSLELAPAAWRLAEKIADTELVPKALKGRPEAVLAVMLAGHEAGISPMMALQKIHIIEGRPAMSAELMRALVMQHGHEIYFEESTTTSCTIAGRRRTTERWTKVTFTTDDAQKAGILGKDVWKKWPRAMLQARATTELCRMIFADVLAGISYSVEELEDGTGDDRGIVDFGPAEIMPPAAPPAKTARAAKAITAPSKSTDAAPKAPTPSGEIPDLPGDDPTEPDVAELEPEPDDDPVDTDADDDITDAEIVDDPPPPTDDEWSSGEWTSDPELERTYTEAEFSRFTGPQQIAIQLGKRFGIKGNTDAARAERLAAITEILQPDREITSSKDLSPDEISTVLSRIRDWPDDVPLFPETPPAAAAPAPPAAVPDLPPSDEGAVATAPTRPKAQRAPAAHPDTWDSDQWRTFLTARKVKVAETMREASRLGALQTPPAAIGTLDDLAGSGIAADLVGWAEDLSLERKPS